jgi:gliding motility-associated-like protein
MLVKFTPMAPFNNQYQWYFPNGNSINKDTPSISIAEQFKGNVRLIVMDKNGCIDSSSQYISLYPNNFNVYLPNAITVNGDLLNDVFKVEGLGEVLDFSLKIYNRWGEEIYFSTDATKAWDGSFMGEFVQEGVYTYLIKFKYFDGKSYFFRGTVTVMR